MLHKGSHLHYMHHHLQLKLITKSTNDDHLLIHFGGTPLFRLLVLATCYSPSFSNLLKSFTSLAFEFLPLCHNRLQCSMLNVYIIQWNLGQSCAIVNVGQDWLLKHGVSKFYLLFCYISNFKPSNSRFQNHKL